MVHSPNWSPSRQTGAAAGETIYMSSPKHALLVYALRFCDHLNQTVIDYLTNRRSRLSREGDLSMIAALLKAIQLG